MTLYIDKQGIELEQALSKVTVPCRQEESGGTMWPAGYLLDMIYDPVFQIYWTGKRWVVEHVGNGAVYSYVGATALAACRAAENQYWLLGYTGKRTRGNLKGSVHLLEEL